MPNIASAKKRMRQDAKRRLRNRAAKSVMKCEVKKFAVALETGDAEAKQQGLRAAVRALDKAVTRGVLHKNAASRSKSRLAAKLKKASSSAPPA